MKADQRSTSSRGQLVFCIERNRLLETLLYSLDIMLLDTTQHTDSASCNADSSDITPLKILPQSGTHHHLRKPLRLLISWLLPPLVRIDLLKPLLSPFFQAPRINLMPRDAKILGYMIFDEVLHPAPIVFFAIRKLSIHEKIRKIAFSSRCASSIALFIPRTIRPLLYA